MNEELPRYGTGHRATHLGGEAAAVAAVTPLQAHREEVEELRQLPYSVERLDLTAAGSRKLELEGNCIVILRLKGEDPEVGIRLGSESAPLIPVTSLGVLSLAYDYVKLEWNAIAGGAADLLFYTALP